MEEPEHLKKKTEHYCVNVGANIFITTVVTYLLFIHPETDF